MWFSHVLLIMPDILAAQQYHWAVCARGGISVLGSRAALRENERVGSFLSSAIVAHHSCGCAYPIPAALLTCVQAKLPPAETCGRLIVVTGVVWLVALVVYSSINIAHPADDSVATPSPQRDIWKWKNGGREREANHICYQDSIAPQKLYWCAIVFKHAQFALYCTVLCCSAAKMRIREERICIWEQNWNGARVNLWEPHLDIWGEQLRDCERANERTDKRAF